MLILITPTLRGDHAKHVLKGLGVVTRTDLVGWCRVTWGDAYRWWQR
jgi:hypothetical protein